MTWLKCEEGYSQAVSYRLRRPWNVQTGRPFLIVILVVLLTTLTACSLINANGPNQTLGSEQQLEGSAVLTCSPECSARGQCGDSDQGKMVLANSDSPATFGHDLAMPEGTAVEVVAEEERTAVQLSDNEQIPVSFYQVDQPEYGRSWVAGWCIGQ